jgi:hypothetical protein
MNQELSQFQDQRDTITANTRTLVPAERLAIGIEDRILPVGASAPDSTLPDSTGR